jgi:hypothetical protein
MSNTRYAEPGTPLRQNRYTSSPAVETGLLANLVALRCSTLTDPADRELIWALQYYTHQPGGTGRIVAEVLGLYGDRFVTQTMARLGKRAGQHYTAAEVRELRKSMPSKHAEHWPLKGEVYDGEDWVQASNQYFQENEISWAGQQRDQAAAARYPTSYPVVDLLAYCQDCAVGEGYDSAREKEESLERFIQRICLDPGCAFADCAPWYCPDLLAVLREYVAHRSARESSTDFAPTALSQTVGQEILDAHEMRRTVLLHNSAANGKSAAARMACVAHAGRARYVRVPASNDETSFLREIAKTLGCAAGLSYKTVQMRERILQVLLTGDLALVLDCGEYLFPVSDYRYALPNRINWLLSDLSAQGVPIVILAHSKIFDTLGFVEKRTGWNRNVFVNQVEIVELPSALEVADVRQVAAVLLPDGDRAAQRELSTHMINSPGYLHSGKPTADRARKLAAQHGHDRVTVADMKAVMDTRGVSARKAQSAALKRADEAVDRCKATTRSFHVKSDVVSNGKSTKRHNAIITSGQLARDPASPPVAATLHVARNRPAVGLQGTGSEAAETQFTASRRPGGKPVLASKASAVSDVLVAV